MLTRRRRASSRSTSSCRSARRSSNGEIKATAVNAGKGSADEFAAVDVKGKVAVVTRSDEVSSPGRPSPTRPRPARSSLVVVNDARRRAEQWVGSDDYESRCADPGRGDQRCRRARAARRHGEEEGHAHRRRRRSTRTSSTTSPATATARSRPTSHYAPKDLARIDTTYHGQKEELGEFRYDFVPGAEYGVGLLHARRARRACARSGSTPTDLRWNQGVGVELASAGRCATSCAPTSRASAPTAEYFGGIVRPYVGLGYWVPYRVSDYAQINVPSWADGGDADAHRRVRHLDGAGDGAAADRRLHRRRTGQADRAPGRERLRPSRRRAGLARRQHRDPRRLAPRRDRRRRSASGPSARPASSATGRTGCCR